MTTAPQTAAQDGLAHFHVRASYATENAHATMLVAEILADAGDGLIALHIETAPIASEHARLAGIRTNLAAARGRKRALKKLGGAEALRLAKLEVSALEKAEEHADRAGLDPHRADIRLVQIYAGGKRVAVLDMYKVDWSVLTQVWECPLVVHNALFELAFLAKRDTEPVEVHDTLQAVRLLRGPDATSLESAVATYFDLLLPKDLQTSDWSARSLTLEQISYAATDPVVTWHLARKILPILHERTTAYEIQMGAIPAVVRMSLRGLHLDTTALNDLIAALVVRRTELVAAYDRECLALGRDVMRTNGVPAQGGAIEALLELLLTEQERSGWPRTKKAGRLSARRADLASAADAYPLLRILIEVGIIDKQINTFGAGLAAQVSPVTGRIHASYRVASTKSGRASCNHPNLQNVPDQQRISDMVSFRTLFRARPGYVFVVGDWSAMEMRAAAVIADDRAMIQVFEDGLDPHDLTAMKMLDLRRDEWEALTKEERSQHRKRAKAVNFGRLFGQGAEGLVQAAREQYGVIIDLVTAKAWIETFKRTYPDYTRWCSRFANACQRRGEIPIGRDGGRVHEIHWNPEGYRYTQCLNLPIQGICADIAMLALAMIDRWLFEAGIDGGPVAWLHDEIVLEVPVAEADRAALLLRRARTEAFLETLPGAPTRGLVEPTIGRTWAEAKSGVLIITGKREARHERDSWARATSACLKSSFRRNACGFCDPESWLSSLTR